MLPFSFFHFKMMGYIKKIQFNVLIKEANDLWK